MEKCKTLILVGPPRTGTTSLFRFLGGDHRICLSSKKETNFFLPAAYGSHIGGLQEYLSYFTVKSDSVILLEASPAYFMGGKKVAEAIIRNTIDPHVVITVREPVERFLSLLTHIETKRNIGEKIEPEKFVLECLNFDRSSFASSDMNSLMSFNQGCYAELISEWIEVFGTDRVKVIFYDDLLRKEPARRMIADLLEWIGLADSNLKNIDMLHENKGRSVKNLKLQKIAMSLNRKFERFLNKNNKARDLLRSIYYKVNGAANEGKNKNAGRDALIAVLKKNYDEKNRHLSDVLKKVSCQKLPKWIPRDNVN